MSLDSKYNRMKEFKRLFNSFKSLKPIKQETQLKRERIIKIVDELYEKYCSAYKNDYDNDHELSEAKKKKFDYKQFELFDKTDEEPKVDEKTKKKIKEIENREKSVEKKRIINYFSYEPITLVNKLLSQNTQDL